jgi:hypothetical protein
MNHCRNAAIPQRNGAAIDPNSLATSPSFALHPIIPSPDHPITAPPSDLAESTHSADLGRRARH